MFVAHLPAGYLLTRRMLERTRLDQVTSRRVMALGLIFSVLPDLDLLYFYLVDQRQTLHHLYWPHLPLAWLGPAVVCAVACAWIRSRLLIAVCLVFYANVFLHLVLDTVAGQMFWLYPFDETSFVLVDVPAQHDWWVSNFVLHWSFGLELLICLWALAVHVRSRRPRRVTLGAVNR